MSMKSLVLAEKPSVGAELARVLKCGRKGKGYFEGNKYVVTWALGHLVTLAEPEDYDPKYREWRLEHLPMLPEKMKLKVMRQTSQQYRVVSSLMKRADLGELVIATDAGREGELVARWIMKLAGWKKPFKRLWISSQTDAAIETGFKSLKPGKDYNRLYDAAVCRAEADWLIGLNITRALTCKHDARLSAGRVQTPTLSLIIRREKEIKEFVPKNYWTITANFGGFSGVWRDKGGNGRIFDHSRALALVEKIKGSKGTISRCTTTEKSESPPAAYDLTELQRDANRRYGFSAKKTLSVLQNLYERHKLVTYPRTDSRYITRDMVDTLPARLAAMATGPYQNLVKSLPKGQPRPGKHFVNDARVTDHHAVIPTEHPLDLKNLDSDERRLYDLVARRFITVLSPPHRYEETLLVTEAAGEHFYSRGKVVKETGWRSVTQASLSERNPGEEDELPTQSVGGQKKGAVMDVKDCKLKQCKTGPPERYTEATLLTAMENPGKFIADSKLKESIKAGGLGTPATRAEIIEKLINSHYVERRGKELAPTSTGSQLVGLVPEELRSPELTARWELRLTNISRGAEKNRAFMADIRKNAAALVKSVREDTTEYRLDNLTKNKCPMCGSFMMAVQDKKGRLLVCPDRKCGHEQPENAQEGMGRGGNSFRASRKEQQMGRRMIDRFSDHKKKPKPSSGTLGDLFEQALGKKK